MLWFVWWLGAVDGLLARAWGDAHRALLTDPTLSRLAECIARTDTEQGAVDRSLVRYCGDIVGLFDSGVIAFTAVTSNEAALPGLLADFVKTLEPDSRHVGAALLRRGTSKVLTVAVAHRRGELEVVCTSGRCNIDAKVSAGHHNPRALWMDAKGQVHALTLDKDLKGTLELKDRGRYQVEIVADTNEGPHVVANRSVFIGMKPAQRPPVISRAHGDAVAEMLTLVNQARASANLGPVISDSRLQQAALGHAEDMREHHFFAHRSPTQADLTDRLSRAGVRFTKATENLARAGNARDAHDSLMDSPGHRMNILDVDSTHIGVGITCQIEHDCLYVVDFAKLLAPLQTDRAVTDVLTRLNRLRRSKGMPDLALDDSLNRLAQLHSERMLKAKHVGYTPAQQVVLDEAMKVAGAAVSIDLFASPSLDVVDQSKSNVAEMRRLGVGVVAGEDATVKMSTYWLTLVWAGPRLQ